MISDALLRACLPFLEMTAASSAAVLLVALLRLPLRRAVGAGAGYALWIMVPASVIAVLLPARSHWLEIPVSLTQPTAAQARIATLAWAIWCAGAAAMICFAVLRQRRFERALGLLSPLPCGAYLSEHAAEPMLIGAWRPRIVLPADFEARYTLEERALVLAHERTHLTRGHALHNAIATLWLCLSWFNPLMYWAVARFRLDQELACDALVLSAAGTARRCYADALLKTQLTAAAGAALPAGCHWITHHPLKERIASLKHPPARGLRRGCGALLALGLSATGTYGVWALQPTPVASAAPPPISECPNTNPRGTA
jgi:bla regulator protein blaR1